jgi:hypothetical protein
LVTSASDGAVFGDVSKMLGEHPALDADVTRTNRIA